MSWCWISSEMHRRASGSLVCCISSSALRLPTPSSLRDDEHGHGASRNVEPRHRSPGALF